MNTVDEMACRELVQVITAYLEGTLPGEDRRRLETHLEECEYCVNYLEQMRETFAALGGLSLDSIAPERRRKILEAFNGWRGAG